MDAQPIKITDAKTAFLLARRAARLAQPLVDKIIGAELNIEIVVVTDDRAHSRRTGIGIGVHHADPNGGLFGMVHQSFAIRDSRALQRRIDELERDVTDRLREMPHMRREVES